MNVLLGEECFVFEDKGYCPIESIVDVELPLEIAALETPAETTSQPLSTSGSSKASTEPSDLECDPNPCLNNMPCMRVNDSPMCFCTYGYEPPFCTSIKQVETTETTSSTSSVADVHLAVNQSVEAHTTKQIKNQAKLTTYSTATNQTTKKTTIQTNNQTSSQKQTTNETISQNINQTFSQTTLDETTNGSTIEAITSLNTTETTNQTTIQAIRDETNITTNEPVNDTIYETESQTTLSQQTSNQTTEKTMTSAPEAKECDPNPCLNDQKCLQFGDETFCFCTMPFKPPFCS